MDKQILDATSMDRTIIRMAHEILEKNTETADIALIGIQTRGVILANRLSHAIEQIIHNVLPMGCLDINFYRDDLTKASGQPAVKKTEINFDLENKTVVLIDDVLFTGRTTRAAMDAMIDFGRPQRIQLAVLVDRGHRELPIRADFVGKNIPTSIDEDVQVRFSESDGRDEVVVVAK